MSPFLIYLLMASAAAEAARGPEHVVQQGPLRLVAGALTAAGALGVTLGVGKMTDQNPFGRPFAEAGIALGGSVLAGAAVAWGVSLVDRFDASELSVFRWISMGAVAAGVALFFVGMAMNPDSGGPWLGVFGTGLGFVGSCGLLSSVFASRPPGPVAPLLGPAGIGVRISL